jgi:hypothetical protein
MKRHPDHPPATRAALEADYKRWRAKHLKRLDEDFAVWLQLGAATFPEDFDSWRQARRELLVEQWSAGKPLTPAGGPDGPETIKTAMLLERS